MTAYGRNHDEWADAAGAYLLRAMPDDETSAYEAHLDDCPACREEVEHLRMAADALPSSPVQLSPPPELKDRIMAVVNAEAELLRAAGARADEPAGQPAPRQKRFAALRPGWWSMRPGLAVASAVMVLALGAGAGIFATSTMRGVETQRIAADLTPPGAKAEMLVRDDGHSTLTTKGMPSPGKGRVYQVWLKRRGVEAPQPTNALFDVRSNGTASVDVPGSMDDVEAVLVTSEPNGGSRTPSRQPVVSLPA